MFFLLRRYADWIVIGPWVLRPSFSHRIKSRQGLVERRGKKRARLQKDPIRSSSDPMTKNATVRPCSVIVLSRLCMGMGLADQEGKKKPLLDLTPLNVWQF